WPELGMEAFYELTVEDYPAVIGGIHGKSIYDK
ncbi:MAG: fumarate hydratase C-terminal domain-containing protein, partial [Erysipelotrichales bacterium]|nr:fumarate hydratase C-terminal domain-containing protein [Erysipelotrichales bacterium]